MSYDKSNDVSIRVTINDSSHLSRSYLISVHCRKLINPGVDEEAFEARNSETDHLSQVTSIPRNHSAPELDIDAALTLCSLNFDPEEKKIIFSGVMINFKLLLSCFKRF